MRGSSHLLTSIEKQGRYYDIVKGQHYECFDFIKEQYFVYHESYYGLFNSKGNNRLEKKYFKAVPHTYLYEHLKQQREEDLTRLVKPKEILMCGRSNIGKSTLINSLFNSKLARRGKAPGTTKTLNYYQLGFKRYPKYLVDSPGYGYLGMKKQSSEKLINMIKSYDRNSSRVCRMFLCVDMQDGLSEEDFRFIENMKHLSLGVSLVINRADRVKPELWMDRALSLTYQLKKYHSFIHPLAHIVSSDSSYGFKSLACSMMQAFEEAPTRKIIRKNNKVYYMLEDKDSVPTPEEQYRYRDLIEGEKTQHKLDKWRDKGEQVHELIRDISNSNNT